MLRTNILGAVEQEALRLCNSPSLWPEFVHFGSLRLWLAASFPELRQFFHSVRRGSCCCLQYVSFNRNRARGMSLIAETFFARASGPGHPIGRHPISRFGGLATDLGTEASVAHAQRPLDFMHPRRSLLTQPGFVRSTEDTLRLWDLECDENLLPRWPGFCPASTFSP
jgi:hypothetical protein